MLGIAAIGTCEGTGARAAAAVTNDVADAHDEAEGGGAVYETTSVFGLRLRNRANAHEQHDWLAVLAPPPR